MASTFSTAVALRGEQTTNALSVVENALDTSESVDPLSQIEAAESGDGCLNERIDLA